MDPSQRINWMDLSTNQIEESLKTKREEVKNKSIQTLTALNKLDMHLVECIKALNAAETHLMNGGKDCVEPFVADISNYINQLKLIGELSGELDEMAFPIALCDYIDQGKNPDLQMKQNYMVTQTKNNMQRARIVNTHALHQYLENGQQYFNKWKQQKNQCINANNKNNKSPNSNNSNSNNKNNKNDNNNSSNHNTKTVTKHSRNKPSVDSQ